ncbi:hypothetical protein L210DRAFT_3652049 [Boletus edulis BED1]|uniref:Uncharacterized protein n=1 Tax=Boletus edulis BED1 TaxID=1328754 RepID=A0AAD4BH08_BOLED|nr:hypothetical protein L210DRAFT_3652049 [Boletus edulis BED1]
MPNALIFMIPHALESKSEWQSRTFEQDSIDITPQLDSSPAPSGFPAQGVVQLTNLHLNPRYDQNGRIPAYAPPPRSTSELLSTLEQFGLPRRIYRDPFYSLTFLMVRESYLFRAQGHAPFLSERLKENPLTPSKPAGDDSQIGRTQANIYGWQSLPAKRSELNTHEGQHTTLFSTEVFGTVFLLNPIVTLFYALGTDDLHSGLLDQGILVVDSPQLNPHRLRDYSLEVLSDELDLINRIIDDVDPDILLGWEV